MIIPDEITAPLSFAALRTDPRGPYLVERVRLSYAPSLSLLLLSGQGPDHTHAFPLRSALFVSDPAFRSDLFSSLPRLPAARRAAGSYAAHYAQAELLSDRQATVPAVLEALARADVFHFDGHGLINSQYPERSGLLLAPDAGAPGNSSTLKATDLPRRMPRRLRLVILGACSTGLTAYRDTAEVSGLAATFLARGIPEVVATAWAVRDDVAADLLDRFHQGLAAGQPTDAALRSAQLGLLHERSTEAAGIATWAAFQVFRGAKGSAMSVYRQRRDDLASPGAIQGGS